MLHKAKKNNGMIGGCLSWADKQAFKGAQQFSFTVSSGYQLDYEEPF
jgi:hypothetical protein